MVTWLDLYSEKSESDSFKLCCYTECWALRVISGCLRSEKMRLYAMVPWSILNGWSYLQYFSLLCRYFQYSAVELLQFRFQSLSVSFRIFISTLTFLSLVANIFIADQTELQLWWFKLYKVFLVSSSRSRKLDRTADHSVLAHLGKSTITESTTNVFTFGLLNIRSLTTKAPLVWDLLKDVSLISSVWLRHAATQWFFSGESVHSSRFLLTLVNPESRVEVVA